MILKDGWSSAYLCILGLIALVSVNQVSAAFTNVTQSAGLDRYEIDLFDSSAHGVAWADYDNDGDLDLYLPYRFKFSRFCKNNGDGTFSDVTEKIRHSRVYECLFRRLRQRWGSRSLCHQFPEAKCPVQKQQ